MLDFYPMELLNQITNFMNFFRVLGIFNIDNLVISK